MAFNRPTLAQLVDRIKKDLEGRLGADGSTLRRSMVKIFATVIAGAMHLLYGFLDWIAKQVFPDSAEEESLLRWGSIYGIERKQASFARFELEFSGANGTIIPALTLLKRSDDIEFETQGSDTVAAGVATVTAICKTAGEIGNTEEEVTLNLVSPIAGLNPQATVGEIVETAVDQEDVEEYRTRVLNHLQEPPQGGTENDYVQWAKEVAGVTRAWCYPLNQGANTVGVAFVMDGKTPSIIPGVPDVELVQEHIDEKRPVTVEVTVFAPDENIVDFEISSLSPSTPEVRAAVTAELKDLFKRDGQPGGTILISRVREAISTAAGELDHELVSPTVNIVSPAGELPLVGEITWS